MPNTDTFLIITLNDSYLKITKYSEFTYHIVILAKKHLVSSYEKF